MKMHRALFDDCDKNKSKLSSDTEPFSISRNLVQRKHDSIGGNNMEMNKAFGVKTKFEKDSTIDSMSQASAINNYKDMEKLNHFITTSEGGKNTPDQKAGKLNHHEDGNANGGAQSFSDFFKSIFRCNATRAGNKKLNEFQSDYPLNLHLRMNEIFSMHDKLSDIAENLNDLYSAGRSCFTSLRLSLRIVFCVERQT